MAPGVERIQALAGDTDGVDGSLDIAGAVIGPDTLARAAWKGLKPREALAQNNGHGFLGRSVITGPTRDVNDFRCHPD